MPLPDPATIAFLLLAGSLPAPQLPTITPAKTDAHGFLVHEIQSPFQSGTTDVRVLLPDRMIPDGRYPVVYVLPVEANRESKYGDGLLEVKKHNLHNEHQAIFVAPSFSHLPWYGDHPTNLAIRQETYFLRVVIPFVERTYPARRDASGRYLLGFSKSGWGAMVLQLRHPTTFAKVAAWDAPFMLDKPDRYGSGEVFANAPHFDAYRIPKLLEQRAHEFKTSRMIVLGYDNFRNDHEQLHAKLNSLQIPHIYRDGPKRKHIWESGWVSEAVPLLLAEPDQIRHAVTKSISLLESSRDEYTHHRNCFSCHHQGVPGIGLSIARSRKYPVNDELWKKQIAFTADFLTRDRERYVSGQGQGGQVDTAGYAMLTLELGEYKSDATTSAVVEYLLNRDKERAFWPTTSRRPPSEASAFTTTYLALRALKSFATTEQQDRVKLRFTKAREWLIATPPKDTEDRVFRLWALKLVGADESIIEQSTRDLVRTQRPDGGWSQIDSIESDAYATGSALVVLHLAGNVDVHDAVYERGVRFLLRTQREDGSWYVHSRSKPFQTYFESGYPHGKDQFISVAAGGWATAALALR